MSVAEKYIIDTYLNLFKGLNSTCKKKLLEKLKKELRYNRNNTENEFFKSFGELGFK